jgi:exopolysaccharide biosynthesis polyprenyl glycosylphosphotransferase
MLPGGSALIQQGAAARARERDQIESPPIAQSSDYRDYPDQFLSRRPALPIVGHRILVLGTLLGDLAVVALGTFVPSLLRFPASLTLGSMRSSDGIILLVVGMLVWLGLLSARGAYWPSVTIRRGHQAVVLVSAVVPAWVLVQLSAMWLKVTIPFESRLVVGLSLPITLLGLLLFRLVVIRPLAKLAYKRRSRGPVLVLADGDLLPRFSEEGGETDPLGRSIIYHSASAMNAGRAASLVDEYEAGEVILETDSLVPGEALEIAFACLDAGAEVRTMPVSSGVVGRPAGNSRRGGLPAMRLRHFDLAGPEVFFKRALDIVGSAIGLILLSPLLLAVALSVKLSSRGPIIYKQKRVGRRGRPFLMFKFRTMADGNDSRDCERYLKSFIRHGSPAVVTEDGTHIYKPPADPRVTGVGAWLRRLSLDELPQLYNTLLGDMSLVGPRPCLPYEWDLYEHWQMRRLDVPPGCTGLWQVKGRSRVRFEDMVILDLYYAHQGTLLSDFRLIAQTFPVMAQGRGAY